MSWVTLTGIVERVTFHNAENGFSVFKAAVKGERELVIIVGTAASIHAGEYVTCQGLWHNNRDFGRQFKAEIIESSQPTSLEGIEKYLASGMIKGIGPVYAKKLVVAFAGDIFTIIENTPERLREIEGVGKMRVGMITKGWQQQKHVRKIMLFLHGHGVTTLRALRIYKTYGEGAIDVIQQNPYQLARDIRGIGFLSADKIALKSGMAVDASARLQAGLHHALMMATDDGHCGLPEDTLLVSATELLQVPQEMLPEPLEAIIRERQVVFEDGLIYLAHLYYQERAISEKIQQLQQGNCPWPTFDTTKALAWVEAQTEMTLAPSQKEVLTQAFDHKVSIITGGPGVGKTTLMKCLLMILKHKVSDILLCAPTGRAARRLSQSTGCEATTIHRLLEPDGSMTGFKRNEDNPLDVKLLIVDESSMIDVSLMAALMKALPDDTAVIFIGDVDQLPSVGPGQVLADMIASDKIMTFRLTEVFRQAATSAIIAGAHAINKGHMPVLDNKQDSDLFFIGCETPEEGIEKIVHVVASRIPKRFNVDAISDIQVLSPMARGKIGARALNQALQDALNPTPSAAVTLYGMRFGVGDKVIQTVNDYDKEIYNGDLGIITSIDLDAQSLTINFEGRDVDFDYADMDAVQLAYAMTIHKSQGSEYPVVVIPFTMQSFMMLRRNLLYTAITRGKNLVVIVGQMRAIKYAISQRNSDLRHTTLKKWLTSNHMEH